MESVKSEALCTSTDPMLVPITTEPVSALRRCTEPASWSESPLRRETSPLTWCREAPVVIAMEPEAPLIGSAVVSSTEPVFLFLVTLDPPESCKFPPVPLSAPPPAILTVPPEADTPPAIETAPPAPDTVELLPPETTTAPPLLV